MTSPLRLVNETSDLHYVERSAWCNRVPPVFPVENYSMWYNVLDELYGGMDIIQLPDKGFMLLVQSGLIRTDANGNFLWYREHEHDFTASSFVRCANGDYAIIGSKVVYNLEDSNGSAVVLRTTAEGTPLWNTTFDSPYIDWGTSIVECGNGDFLVTITSEKYYEWSQGTSGGGQGLERYAVHLLRLTNEGTPLWNSTYGEGYRHYFSKIIACNDGSFAIVGGRNITNPFDIILPDNDIRDDIWVLRVDSGGTILGNYIYDIGDYDRSVSIVESQAGGFAITGHSNHEYFLLRVSDEGAHLWHEVYPLWQQYPYDLVECQSGGYAIIGRFRSYGVELPPNLVSLKCCNEYDIRLVRTNETGTLQWDFIFGAYEPDYARAIVECSDGGFVITGDTFIDGTYPEDGGTWLVYIPDEVPPEYLRNWPPKSSPPPPNLALITLIVIVTASSMIAVSFGIYRWRRGMR
ncbi:MAG: hypothetical protein ACFE8F_12120 [Promethearchaeota archaeon]